MASYYPLEIPRCRHIRDNGVRCGSPALRGKPFCYNHNDMHRERLQPGHKGYKFRPLETGESVTMQVADIAQAAHDGTISLPLGRLLLYAIQIGAQQMKHLGATCQNVETEVTAGMEERGGSEEIGSADHLVIGSSEQDNSVPCHPEPGRMPEPQEPVSVAASNDEPVLSHELIKNPLPTVNVTADSDDQMRKSIFHPDPVAVRAYWTQHLPPEVVELRCPSGEPVYTPPEWLPLTEEQLAYLRERMGPDCGSRSPEEQENLDRMNLHCTHMMVEPPQPERIIQCHKDLWNSDKMWSDFSAQVRKDPKAAVKMMMEQVG